MEACHSGNGRTTAAALADLQLRDRCRALTERVRSINPCLEKHQRLNPVGILGGISD